MNVKVSRHDLQIKARIEAGRKQMVAVLTEQVVKDSNIYCRQDQGTLMASAISSSRPDDGLAIWNTPYAKRMYYTGTPSTDVNPNASLLWVEKARKLYAKTTWKKIAQKGLSEGMK